LKLCHRTLNDARVKSGREEKEENLAKNDVLGRGGTEVTVKSMENGASSENAL
jgi:hypothetical protein